MIQISNCIFEIWNDIFSV